MATEGIDGLSVDLDRLPPDLNAWRRTSAAGVSAKRASARSASKPRPPTTSRPSGCVCRRSCRRSTATSTRTSRSGSGEAILVGATAEAALAPPRRSSGAPGSGPGDERRRSAPLSARARSGGGRVSSAARRSPAGPARRDGAAGPSARGLRGWPRSPRASSSLAGPRRSAVPRTTRVSRIRPLVTSSSSPTSPRGSASPPAR